MYEKNKKRAKQLIAFGSALQCSSFCKKFLSKHTHTYNLTVRPIPRENKYKKYHYL